MVTLILASVALVVCQCRKARVHGVPSAKRCRQTAPLTVIFDNVQYRVEHLEVGNRHVAASKSSILSNCSSERALGMPADSLTHGPESTAAYASPAALALTGPIKGRFVGTPDDGQGLGATMLMIRSI